MKYLKKLGDIKVACLEREIIREIGDFFGVPGFRLNLDIEIQGYFNADEVDIKELNWMIEEKYGVVLEKNDLQSIKKLVSAIQRNYIEKTNIKGGNIMTTLLTNKKAVVTGASTGIGREIGCILGREGAEVALIGRRNNELEKTKRMIIENGGKAEVFIADLRFEASSIAKKIIQKLGTVDIICNVAGVWHDNEKAFYGPRLWELSDEEILEVMQVGIIAPMLLTKSLLPSMIERKYGKILNISGTFENGAKGWLHYYISKKAIEEFTVGLSQELREHKIQVNTISPSDTYTEAYRKFYPDEIEEVCMNPRDIARLALELVIDDFDFITGQTIIARNKNA